MPELRAGICDWCGAEGVVIAWPVPEIRGHTPPDPRPVLIARAGTWAACADCRPLVEAHDIDGLLERADARYGVGKDAETRELLRQVIRGMYVAIDRSRGEAVPVASWPEWVE